MSNQAKTSIRKRAWDCKAFNDVLFNMALRFDEEILKEWSPIDDMWITAKITDMCWWQSRESVRRIVEKSAFVDSVPTKQELEEYGPISTMKWDDFVKTLPPPYLQEAWNPISPSHLKNIRAI